MLTVRDADKQQVVLELVSGQGRTLAFTRTKHGAKKLAKQLTAAGIPAVDLHGNLSQAARKRNLAAFSTGQVRVPATDIAARGIHVDDIDMVVHVDPAAEHKTYLHRCGRTARAGAEGKAISVGTRRSAATSRACCAWPRSSRRPSRFTLDMRLSPSWLGRRPRRTTRRCSLSPSRSHVPRATTGRPGTTARPAGRIVGHVAAQPEPRDFGHHTSPTDRS